jgi:hypothetical protein
VHGIENESKVPLIGECAKPSLEEEFLCKHPKKTLDELINLSQSGIFVVCAKVIRIVDGQDWWYPASNCHKMLFLMVVLIFAVHVICMFSMLYKVLGLHSY